MSRGDSAAQSQGGAGSAGGAVDALARLHVSQQRRTDEYGRRYAEGDEEDVMTPIKPSAKALGKRRAVDATEEREGSSVILCLIG
jgi:hypothetical protein